MLADNRYWLHEAIGQYASGETPIFHGQLQAREDRTTTGVDEILTIDTTRAIASLSYQERLEGAPVTAGHVLTAFDSDARLLVRLIQTSNAPTLSYASSIRYFFTTDGNYASCSNCLLEPAVADDEISFDLSAHGQYPSVSVPMQVDVKGHFSRVPVVAITLEDLLAVASFGRSPFQRVEPRRDVDANYVVLDMTGYWERARTKTAVT